MDSNHQYCCEQQQQHAEEEEEEEEEYIDMEVGSQSSSAAAIFSSYSSSSSSRNSCISSSSSSHNNIREFEFQMSSNYYSSGREDTAPSPADELFYKGKLLPLHLPPRLQMVEKLLLNHNSTTTTFDYNQKPNKFDHHHHDDDESFSTPLFTPTDNNTPFESCQVSRELNPDDYFLECSSSSSSSSDHHHHHHQNYPNKKSWTKKLKLINQYSSFGSKLKASRAYLKSLFNKTACSAETSAADDGSRNYFKEYSSNKYVKKAAARKEPFGQIHKGAPVIKTLNKESIDDNNDGCRGGGGGGGGNHRRSFSGAIKRISMTRSSSSLSSSISSSSASASASTSTDSNGFRDLQFFKRSNSFNSDMENPIQAAIAHCKRSQQKQQQEQEQQEQQFHSRKNANDLSSFCSLSAARVVHHEEQRPALCRG